jgi:hypothetical protein
MDETTKFISPVSWEPCRIVWEKPCSLVGAELTFAVNSAFRFGHKRFWIGLPLLGIGGKYIGVHLNQYNGLLYSQHCSSLWMVALVTRDIGVHLNKYTGLIYFVHLWCLCMVGWPQFLNQTPCMKLFVLSSFLVRVVTSNHGNFNIFSVE